MWNAVGGDIHLGGAETCFFFIIFIKTITISVHNNNRWVPDSDVAAAATVIDLSVKRVYTHHEFYKCLLM